MFAVGHIFITWYDNRSEWTAISKYEPLWTAIGGRTEDSFALTYDEIEQILGFPSTTPF
ncbi:MAG: hypothetical protein L0I10_07835 [Bifidobacterium crudilactis]|uniref:hypothetical protein n=1 Tax=Bifidobacterium crudilactis TaxID=327277 RepID=UPI002649C441|nr:hypothetical protein [Bifidobacterium crudilactis]MDN5972961.1 hypothetical protein [Bifidobacterium crudilactis]